MPFTQVRREYEERRAVLADRLRNGRGELDAGTQHQIYGAIKEIDALLPRLVRAQEEHSAREALDLRRDEPRRSALEALRDGVGTFAQGASTVFSTRIVAPTRRACKAAKERAIFVRDVVREVKAREKKS